MFPDTITASLHDDTVKQAERLSAEERQALFLQYSCKANEVWMLKGDDGFIMLESSDGVALPVWPHRDLIGAWHTQGISAKPVSVPLDDFLSLWLPGMANNGTSVVVYPVSKEDAGMLLTADELLSSFSEEAK